jgi:hypothetical protein
MVPRGGITQVRKINHLGPHRGQCRLAELIAFSELLPTGLRELEETYAVRPSRLSPELTGAHSSPEVII